MPAPLPPTLRPARRLNRPLRRRAEFPALAASPQRTPAGALHDFLVPNPRPDLAADVSLARMLER